MEYSQLAGRFMAKLLRLLFCVVSKHICVCVCVCRAIARPPGFRTVWDFWPDDDDEYDDDDDSDNDNDDGDNDNNNKNNGNALRNLSEVFIALNIVLRIVCFF